MFKKSVVVFTCISFPRRGKGEKGSSEFAL
jgi:hypothetical protein